jgi:hypothetical protein
VKNADIGSAMAGRICSDASAPPHHTKPREAGLRNLCRPNPQIDRPLQTVLALRTLACEDKGTDRLCSASAGPEPLRFAIRARASRLFRSIELVMGEGGEKRQWPEPTTAPDEGGSECLRVWIAYFFLTSSFTWAAPPSGMSISCSTFPANGCQATSLCLPAGISLISNVPSSFTTA